MIGRGAIGNPWIFSRRERASIPLQELNEVLSDHLDKMLAYHGIQQGLLRFRKHLKAYLSHYKLPGETLRALLTATSEQDLRQRIEHVIADLSAGSGRCSPKQIADTIPTF
jgi:tRNA-dihydrouridine synthase